MTRAFVFWLLMLLWLIFALWIQWPVDGHTGVRWFGGVGGSLLEFVLFALLGWQVFGSAVKP